MPGGERIDRLYALNYECRARWRHQGHAAYAVAHISVGELDGTTDWYVHVTGPDQQATRWPDKLSAWREVQRLMAVRDGPWEKVPCHPSEGWRPGEQR